MLDTKFPSFFLKSELVHDTKVYQLPIQQVPLLLFDGHTLASFATLDMASDPDAYIYQGFWVSADKTGLWGLNITLTPTNATFLTNSLALLITLCGSQLWTIMRYLLHQMYASSHANERCLLMHNKHQTILRNTPTAVQNLQLTLGLAWTSR